MFYWVIYDISEDKERSRVSNVCKNYGLIRVQKSAFIGDLSRNAAEMMAMDMEKLGIGTKDCIFIIPSCRSCFGNRIIKGIIDTKRLEEHGYRFVGDER